MPAFPSLEFRSLRGNAFTWGAVTLLALFRLAHIHLLWADEDFHLAAALNILKGRIPYCGFLYDKPPLSAFYYLLIGAHAGWPLRLLDAGYVLLACYLLYRLAREFWGENAARIAALLFAFFMTFYLPSAVISFAPDALMIVPHLAAMHLAQRSRAGWAGFCSGVAFLVNPKAVFVLAACGLWVAMPPGFLRNTRKTGPGLSTPPEDRQSFLLLWRRTSAPLALPQRWGFLAAGFALPLIAAFGALSAAGAWSGYIEQVWWWGLQYARQPPSAHPFLTGITLTADWLGFHAALAVAAGYALIKMNRTDRLKLISWLALSFVAVALGGRFSPRYFLQVLPPLVLLASEGFRLLWQTYRMRAAAGLAVLLLIPLLRFGPRYAMLAVDNVLGREPHWSDVALDLDDQHSAARIKSLSHPGDTLFVWGYRPAIYVYTRMISDSRFWESQPLTGVPADRHLTATTVIDYQFAAANRAELIHTRPTFLVDGLGPINPKLAPNVYPELRPWLQHYRVVAKTGLTMIYRRSE